MFSSIIWLRARSYRAVLLSLVVSASYTPLLSAKPVARRPLPSRLRTLPTDSGRVLKQAYSVRHPVPKGLMRELATDRPDVTESAYSVDAGHFQLETDLVRLVRQTDGTSRQQEIDLNAINLKLGLTRTTDLELIVDSYTVQTEPGSQPQAGFGDLTLRLKRNLWGNDGGLTALSLIPFIKVPSGRTVGNRAWEGGIVAPFAWQLPRDWTFGSQLQATLNRDVEASAYYVQLAPTLTMGHDIYRTLGGFVELAGYWDVRRPDWRFTLNGGPILRLGDTLQLDLGVNLALTPHTPSSYFLGLSFRH